MAATTDAPFAGPLGSEVKSLASLVKKSFSSSGLGTPLIIPKGYGCVVLIGIGSVVLLKWKSMKVSEARRDFTVPNPITHSDSCMNFNCTYRAMQSTLEIYPQFLFLLLTGGLELPYLSTVGGFIWIVGRYAYAKGYYSGDPRKRANGGFYIVGQFLLLIGAIKFALKRMVL
ncbi:unnamed protein product [Orchesella dallaii]|uniref:Microsomal glutathione S-transferase 3 n=1 Tax=Orchesella dallaii TaxID=48710 RepID=A0ABP1S036_9HEXA